MDVESGLARMKDQGLYMWGISQWMNDGEVVCT